MSLYPLAETGHGRSVSLVNVVIDEALDRAQRGDTRMKDALSRLTPFELYDAVYGIADVVRRPTEPAVDMSDSGPLTGQ